MFKKFLNSISCNNLDVNNINGVTYINGRRINAPDGANISIINNKVYINGKLSEEYSNDIKEDKEIIIKVEGNTGNINASNRVTIKGNVNGDIDAGNSVEVSGDVNGDIDAGNSVNVKGTVKGNIDAGNSVFHR